MDWGGAAVGMGVSGEAAGCGCCGCGCAYCLLPPYFGSKWSEGWFGWVLKWAVSRGHH